MTAKIILAFACMLTFSALGVSASESHIVRPYSPEFYSSTEQFEYEFEWQNGKIIANP
ncbi:hypothetical protein [Paenibacillus andongensis]|uniref:hypothetical protein n=1 Tax=Paenibacillus andongensis TaxID=2975482 RepID=UPI0021BB9EDA|nr:hypothetical protein [Paenibacillus andongensis]